MKAQVVIQRPGDGHGQVVGEPRVVSAIPVPPGAGCPKCGSFSINMMEIRVVNDILTTGKGIGSYAKCGNATCDWESEIVARATND
jgi:hypothetical protein